MELFDGFETTPGIRSDDRFPLVALFYIPLRGMLSRSVPNTPYHSNLTFRRPQRHFLAIWPANQHEPLLHSLPSLNVLDCSPPGREAMIDTHPLRSPSRHFIPSPTSGDQRALRPCVRHSGESWGHSPSRSDRVDHVHGSPRDRLCRVDATH